MRRGSELIPSVAVMEATSPLLLLPPEILKKIFELVDPTDWISLMRVCSQTRMVASDEELWRNAVLDELRATWADKVLDFADRFLMVRPWRWSGKLIDRESFQALNPEWRIYPKNPQ